MAVTIMVDGRSYQVDPRHNLLEACLNLGMDVPYFCWHPELGSVGACRQCAVKQFKDENDQRGRIVMSCMTAAKDGTRIALDDPDVRAAHASVIEWLMTNHPHDCPVCEEGGECHLQDMTVMSGHTYRRYRFDKRTFRNQDLGPFINHEMNRCITCYRCVRFYQDYAGGRDLQAFASKNHVYFGRIDDGTLENSFSGNLAEVCPTGVFTDKTLGEHYTRKWDLRATPSVCVHCGLGCNTSPNERYGELRRIVNRYNGEVNRYFLCDRGRFGYAFVNSEKRIRQPLLREARSTKPAGPEQALAAATTLLANNDAIMGIGSPRASLEANFALRTLVGPERFCSGMSTVEARLVALILDILRRGPARTPSLREAEQADAILVLGEDLDNTAPRLALSLRQAVREKGFTIADNLGIDRWNDTVVRTATQDAKSPLFIATPLAMGLDDLAATAFRAAPDDIARLGFAVARYIDSAAPGNGNLKPEDDMARAIAKTLQSAQRPLIIAGTGLGSEAVVQAAANVAWALCNRGHETALCYTVAECDSLGVGMLGGNDLEAVFTAAEEDRLKTLVVLENDLYRRASRPRVDALLNKVRLIALDHLHNATTDRADVVFPAATFAEGDGTLVSNEGRAQRLFQLFPPGGPVRESWRWLQDLKIAVHDGRPPWRDLDDVTAACAAAHPELSRIVDAAPGAGFRIAGMRIAREPHRYSGRTAMHSDISVHEPQPASDVDSPLSFTMEGSPRQPPSSLTPYFWAPRWNSIQSVNKFQDEVGGPLRGGDPGVRLVQPAAPQHGPPDYFQTIPPPFKARKNGEVLVIPAYHIFGSEELSVLSPGIRAQAPQPYLAVHPDDSTKFGETVELTIAGTVHQLTLQPIADLPRGLAALPAGFAETLGLPLPAWGTLRHGR